MKKQLSFVLFVILTSQLLFSQTELDERAVIRFDRGLGFFAPDSTFGLNLRFRMQNRLGFATVSEDNFSINEVEARIRRLRLRIDGYMKSNRLTYYLQLSFSRSDQDFDESGVPHIIRDAMVYYHFNKNFYVGFGQGKLPGNRERITSSGHLQFTDRSIGNAIFNIDRDFGVFAYYTLRGKSALINFKTAISSGEGRNALVSDNGLAYTGRFEFLPFGSFKNDGDFAQGDTEREISPKLAIAASYSLNKKAVRLSGQRGKALFEPRDLESFFVDLLFKYKGWAYYSEYASRTVNSPVLIDEESNSQFVFDGYGFNNQLSYRFNNMFELAFRYSYVVPNKSIVDMVNNSSVYTLGLNKYIWKHKVKVQTNLSYLSDKPETEPAKNKWNLQFQVELGI